MPLRIAAIFFITLALILQPLMAAAPRICGDCPTTPTISPAQTTSEGGQHITSKPTCCNCISATPTPSEPQDDNNQDNQDNDDNRCGCGKPCCGKSPPPPAVATQTDNNFNTFKPTQHAPLCSPDAAPTRTLTGLKRPPRASFTF